MAIPSSQVWEVQTGGSDTLNAGGFDPSNANMDATGAAIFATTSAPCFNSANATAELADVGYHVFIKSGTNWTAGWYPITSVGLFSSTPIAGGSGYTVNDVLTLTGGTGTAAQVKVTAVTGGFINTVAVVVAGSYTVLPTFSNSVTGGTGSGASVTGVFGWILNAAIGASPSLAFIANTVAGCATTSSPTAATWSCDFTQNATARYAYTGMVIDATTNTNFTHAAPMAVSKKIIGNTINVASGTGFTVQFVTISSTSTITATCDKSLGTLSSTGGTGGLGGALATLAKAVSVMVSGNTAWLKSGVYSTATQIDVGTSIEPYKIYGYGSVRGDGIKATLKATAAITVLNIHGNNGDCEVANLDLDGNASVGTNGFVVTSFRSYCAPIVSNVIAHNFSGSGLAASSGGAICILCSFYSNGTYGAGGGTGTPVAFIVCVFRNNTSDGTHRCQGNFLNCLAYSNGGIGFENGDVGAAQLFVNCVSYANTGAGFGSLTGNTRRTLFTNCIAYKNTGIGFAVASSDIAMALNCATGANSSAFSNVTQISGNVALLTTHVDGPFNAPASGDFSLNALADAAGNVKGGGAALRAKGYPGLFPAGLTTGYVDIGSAQHADPVAVTNIIARRRKVI